MTKPKPAIKMSDETLQGWKGRIDAASKRTEKFNDLWQKQQSAYGGTPLDEAPAEDTCMVNKDMPRVKQKVAQLFYQVPEIHLKPKAPQWQPAASIFQAVINHKLKNEIGVVSTVDEVLTDVIAVSGIGVSKVGYEVVAVDVDMPLVDPQVAETLTAAGQQIPTEKQPVPIFERYFWNRVSPAKLLVPSEFTGTDFDKAAWIGIKYRKPLEVVKRDLGIAADHEASTRDELVVSERTENDTDRTQKEVECTEIWYKAYLFDGKERNPLKQRRIVFVDGEDQPLVHEDSPYQRFDEQGKFVVGMKKFPIRILVLTTVPDEAIPPSDTTVSRPLVSELQLSRSQMVKQRQRALPIRWYNTSILDPETIVKIERGEIGDLIPVPAPGDQAIGEVARANYPRENFDFQRVIEGDLEETWAMGSNQMGNNSPGEQSATESQIIQGNTNVRLDYERNKVLRWFLDGTELIGDLLQLFADDQDYIEVVGEDRVKQLATWDKNTIAGEFVFEAKTNSALRLDVAQERQDSRNTYQLMANEPFANRQKLVEWVATTHDIDPAQFLVQPPPKQPDPPNVSFRFSGDDLNPLNPSFAIVLEVLAKGGFQLSPESINAAKLSAATMMATGGMPKMAAGEISQPPQAPPDTEHGGVAKQADNLSKSQADQNDYR
jgi:hypothetical protein